MSNELSETLSKLLYRCYGIADSDMLDLKTNIDKQHFS